MPEPEEGASSNASLAFASTAAGGPDGANSDRVTRVFREHHARLVSSLAGRLRDLDLAEDSVQEAYARAIERWPTEGPRDAAAWLYRVAYRRALDVLRGRKTSAARLDELAAEFERLEIGGVMSDEHPALRDDLLRLIFTCCHPTLSVEARVALALKTLCGLTTNEIGRALLVNETTLAQRLVRAKRKIAGAGIGYRVPDAEALPERVEGVLAVIYLLFNEGYLSTEGPDPMRSQLADEAIRLARLVAGALPEASEARGLLALLLLTNARGAARFDPEGRIVRLGEQDRSRWDAAQIDEGRRIVDALFARGEGRTRYGLQAAIATLHAEAPTAEATPWGEIEKLYAHLTAIDPSPIVALNHAVAIAEVQGPAVGLERVEALAEAHALERYAHYHSARAELLGRLGRREEEIAALERAVECVRTPSERRFLEERLASLHAE